MKISMKVMFLSMVLILSVTAANAQKKGDNLEDKAKAETEELLTALGLNDDVKTKAYEITLKAAQDSKEVYKAFKAGDISEEDKKMQMKEINKKKTEDIKAILTPKQKKAYADFKKEQQAAKKAKD